MKHRGEHPGRIDVKHEGITIVTNLARVYAIVAGLTENRTTERLRGAASAGTIPTAPVTTWWRRSVCSGGSDWNVTPR